ncbi:S8 family serine peptidase [Streptomyces sp. MK7]|uniref:S8 family peptidase n=1 Tax=Streptomyces sp. MK7 TaxID=3067635 RepID=UPI00292DBF1C|nr:S8 family serine peptidase [Streptomyces sp. MK7]
MRRIRLAAAISAGFALAAGAMAPFSAGASGLREGAVANAPAGGTATVQLITGDSVTVTKAPGGRQTASVTPGAGRRGIVFRTLEEDGHLTVLPSDAGPLVGAGRLDRQLFDVTALVAQGYDKAHTDTLPLIVAGPGKVAASAMRGLTALAAGGAPVRRLDSIDAQAMRVTDSDLGRLWRQLVPDAAELRASEVAATPRVWLDGRVGAALDRSTAQIGAPDVWQAGYRGDGVKVAVLDTGVDQTHPDLAGRVAEAKDFSGSSGTGDVFGHGTHVASIVGGSGAASGGRYKGVAPAAQLLVGKVLGDDGYGSESQVIAGMEWAASQGAKVVNMSLGSEEATDGTDPMSQALNDLSRSTGTLFVVAAGNSGEQGATTVGSPGAADEAITVGAVDRDDSLAPFSSRGPRLGDDGAKPDVTAPGVGIVAARAAGTTMGDPVDEHYVAASGTSMATPHVAGAAALLAQRHPDWTGAQLKDALISTAHTVPGQQVTEEGGGRIDVRAAALGTVTATGSLALGPFSTSAAAPATSRLRYTNASDEDLTLSLSVKLTTTGGRALADGAVRLGSDSVRVPAGATTEVPLTVDPARAGKGKFYGYVNATSVDGKTTVHTTLSLVVHGPVHRITVETYDRTGTRVPALPTIWGPDGFVDYTSTEPAVAEVEEGTYQVDNTWLDTVGDGQELCDVVLPEVKVTKDMTVTVDARKTVPVDIRTPRPAEQRGVLSYQTYREIDGHSLTQATMYFDSAKRLYVSPTARVTDGAFEFASRWQLVAPLLRAKVAGSGLDLNAYYMPASPLFSDRGATLTAVDAGDAATADFSHARGRLAVVKDPTGAYEKDLVARAASAGVRAVMLVHFSDIGWTRWDPQGERWAVPTVRIGSRAGADLLARIANHSASVTFSGTARSPYLYDVMQVSAQQIPEHVVYTVSERDSAVVRSTYADNGGSGWASEQRFGWRPYQNTAWLQYTRFVPTGFTRTEYISAGDTTWQHLVHHTTTFDVDMPLAVGMRDVPRAYRAGAQPAETWQGAVVRPSIPIGTTTPTVRVGNVLRLRIPEFTDSQSGHWSRAEAGDGGGVGTSSADRAGDATSAVLYRDGRELTDLDSAWADMEVPADAAQYRLDLTTSRNSPDWKDSVATSTSWSFRSARTDTATPLSLLQLDYAVPVDAHNVLHAGHTHAIGVRVRAQDGLPAPSGVTVQVEASYDDGRTWSTAKVTDRGRNAFQARVDGPSKAAAGAWVTLRVTARDAAGNTVCQTVQRAYALQR